MKLYLTFKRPDVVTDALDDAGIIDEDEKEACREACRKWITYGELLTVEIDTETGELKGCPA
jgi:hypothetical protein